MASRDDTRSPDLQKLEEKFRRAPTSTLFFPLAEEYAKAGQLQEAITLLRTGIKAHPDLLGARVALGKALLSKGQTEEAKREFEQVVTANPDNLMAHKKLAAIYAKAGDKRKALASCEMILTVNPTDAEAVRLRDEIGPLPDVAPEDEATVQVPVSALVPPEAEATVADQRPELADVEPTVTMVEPTVTMMEPTVGMVPQPPVVEPAMVDSTLAAPTPVESDASEVNEVGDEELATISLADLYVTQGHYQRGIAIYRRMLERAPGDTDLASKLDNALTLERLLSPAAVDSETVKTEVVHHVLAGSEPSDVEPESVDPQPSLAGAVTGLSPHDAAIQRLEVWLARIAERRRR